MSGQLEQKQKTFEQQLSVLKDFFTCNLLLFFAMIPLSGKIRMTVAIPAKADGPRCCEGRGTGLVQISAAALQETHVHHCDIPATGRRDREQFRWGPTRRRWSKPQSPSASGCLRRPGWRFRPLCTFFWPNCWWPTTTCKKQMRQKTFNFIFKHNSCFVSFSWLC